MKLRFRIVLVILLTFISAFCFLGCGNISGNKSDVVESDVDAEEPGGGNDTPEGPNARPDGQNVLVAYFSATGNTQSIARYISDYTGGTLYEIEAKIPYTVDDIKYYTDCRVDKENSDPSARPEIQGVVRDMESYDVVFIGYPIWFGKAPKIIYTFIESYDFTGKAIIPFCTSASSGIGSSAENLHVLASGAKWNDGRRFAIATDEATVNSWIEEMGIIIQKEITMVRVHCGSNVLDIELEDNPSARAFCTKAKAG